MSGECGGFPDPPVPPPLDFLALGRGCECAGIWGNQGDFGGSLISLLCSPQPDFLALGGLETLVKFLGHPRPPLRARAARALGSCAQNLPPAQGGALALGALPPLLGALRGDPDPQVAPAALFAISCEFGGEMGGPQPRVGAIALCWEFGGVMGG